MKRKTKTAAGVIEALEFEIDYSKRVQTAWLEKFEQDSAHAFEWSSQAMEAAGSIRALSRSVYIIQARVEEGIDDAGAISSARENAQNEALRVVENPPSSTSVPSNLMEQYVGKAYAKLISRFNGILRNTEQEVG